MSDWNRSFVLASAPIDEIRIFSSLDSTNDWVKRFLTENRRMSFLPFWIIAEQQTSGRGRGTHSWWTGLGNLAGTLAFSGNCIPVEKTLSSDTFDWTFSQQFADFPLTQRDSAVLSSAIALATAKTVRFFLSEEYLPERLSKCCLPEVLIHWPNDIYVGNRKIAGILTETTDTSCFVVGIGVNINGQTAQAPQEIREKLASLADFLPNTIDINQFLVLLTRFLFSELRNLSRNERKDGWELSRIQQSEFYARCRQINRKVLFEESYLSETSGRWEKRTARGTGRGISLQGGLLVEKTPFCPNNSSESDKIFDSDRLINRANPSGPDKSLVLVKSSVSNNEPPILDETLIELISGSCSLDF